MSVPGEAQSLLADVRQARPGALPRLWALMLLGALADSVGIFTLVPLAAILLGEPPAILAPYLDAVAPTSRVPLLAAIFVAMMLAKAAIGVIRDRYATRLDNGYEADLRTRLLSGLAGQGWLRARHFSPAALQRTLWADVSRVSIALSQIHRAVLAGLLLAIQGIATLLLAPAFSLFAAALMILAGGLVLASARKSRQEGEAVAGALASGAEDGQRLHTALKASLAERNSEQFVERFARSARQLAQSEIALADTLTTSRHLIAGIAALSAAALLLAGTYWFDVQPELLLPLLIIFARLSGPAQQLAQAVVGLSGQLVAFGQIRPLLQNTEIASSTAAPLDWSRIGATSLVVRASDEFSVGPVEFALERGQWLVLEGPSGSGKSLLVDCVAGLLPPHSGSLFVDGLPLRGDHAHRWAATLSYVGQDSLLFGQTVGDCLETDDDARACDLIKLVGLSAAAFPLYRDIGPGGRLVSGGERQRIAIARALLRNPSLLILDEATASLDLPGEGALLTELRREYPHLSLILVSHRPQSARSGDVVVTLSDK